MYTDLQTVDVNKTNKRALQECKPLPRTTTHSDVSIYCILGFPILLFFHHCNTDPKIAKFSIAINSFAILMKVRKFLNLDSKPDPQN